MNLRDLNYLVAVAEYRHFGKAAEACFVSQPTLSAQLIKLEAALGVKIFERSNRQILITPIGKQLVTQAQNILREINYFHELAKNTKDPLIGEFRLGIIPTVGPYLLPYILPTIKKHLPQLKILLHEDKTTHILEGLKQGKLDAVILAIPVPADGCKVKKLFQEPFLVAMPKNHRLANKKLLEIKDLKNENLLLLEDGHCLREQALDICHFTQLRENAGFYATNLETLQHLVAAGNGITLLPALAATKNNQIVVKPLAQQKASRTIGMLWRKQSRRAQCCQMIADMIFENLQATLPF